MNATLLLQLELEVFQTEEVLQAEQKAKASHFQLYSWKTCGVENWLERGLSIADVLGIVVLPPGLPDIIDMPDDTLDGT